MRHGTVSVSLMALLGMLALGGCRESSLSRAPETSAKTEEDSGEELLEQQPNIDPRAQAELHKMSDLLGRAESFSFQSIATMEVPVAADRLGSFSRKVRIVVHRPDEIMAEGRQGKDAIFLWYEGNRLTLLDKTADTYSVLQVPNRIDEMLDDVANRHGLTLPLADLLFSNPYRILTADVDTGNYVDEADVDGTRCHHLLFSQETIDWQIWIEAGAEPVPRKLVIDYKNVPERPQFSAVLSNWDLSAPVTRAEFQPEIPTGAKMIEVSQLLAAGQGE